MLNLRKICIEYSAYAENTSYIYAVMYIYQLKDWPKFIWDKELVTPKLIDIRHKQGKLVGRMEGLGFQLQTEATLRTLTLDVLKSSEIEGEVLDHDQVRSSIARRLGMDIAGLIPADRNVEGVVEMMLDATQNYYRPLSTKRLFDWHAAMFPTGRSGMYEIVVGAWRKNTKDDPMQVVSGPLGRERVHYQAPDSEMIDSLMEDFLKWFNSDMSMDPVLKAAVAHLWFVTIHPFDDGNGRISRAVTDMQLARSDKSSQRFYSMSSQIRQERKAYYDILEKIQRGDLDITGWLVWFIECLERGLEATDETLAGILKKASFWEKHASTTLNERQVKMLNKLFDGFEGKLTTSKWAKMTKCSQDSAGRDINDLLEKDILVKSQEGGRSTNYFISE